MRKIRSEVLKTIVLWLVVWLLPNHAASQYLDAPVIGQLTKTEQYLEQGRFVEGLKAARLASTLYPAPATTPDTLAAKTCFLMGRCYALLQDDAQAILYFDSALIYLGDSRPALYYAIGNQLGARKRDAERMLVAKSFFEGNDLRQFAECLYTLGAFKLSPLPPGIPAEFRQSLDLLQSLGLGQSALAGRCHMLLGYSLWKIDRQHADACVRFRNAEAIFLQNGGPASHYLAALYVNLGGCLDEMGYPGKAVALYKNAEQNLLEQNAKHPLLVNVYNNLGTAYSDLNEYTLSIRYLQKAVEIKPNSGIYLNNLGDAFMLNGDWEEAEKCFNKALAIYLKSNKKEDQFRLARPYHNLAIIYRQRGQLDSALRYELISLPYRKSVPKDYLNIARSYAGAGEYCLDLKRYPEALRYLDSALWLQALALPARRYAGTAYAYAAKARCMSALRQYSAAFVCIDSALLASGYVNAAQWEQVTAPPEMLTALGEKAALHFRLFRETAQERYLLAAVEWYDTAAQAIRYFRNTLLNSESKATLAGQFRDILSGGIEACLALHQLRPAGDRYLRRAFSFSEQSKALVLLEGLRSIGTGKFAGVPDSILDRERLLRVSVTEAEVALKKMLEKSAPPGDEQQAALKNMLFDHQRDVENFQRMLAVDFPAYHNFRYGVSFVTPEALQTQWLPPGSTLLSYYIGKENRITVFVVGENRFQAINCPVSGNLDSLVEAFREGLFGYYSLPSSRRNDDIFENTVRQFISAGQALYSMLLAPVEHLLSSEVVIVPDGLLAKIPFELLLTATPSNELHFKEYPYWFKTRNHSVSYTYSATLLREMTQKQHLTTPALPFFAMAPFFPGNKGDVISGKSLAELTMTVTAGPGKQQFKSLPYSGAELRDIGTLWNGRYEVGNASAKSLFLREAANCRILHLSTHGVLDSTADFSYLAFAPAPGETEADPLYIRDLYNLQLNADLVTLSACETGVGKLQHGEGVISLARAFAYAGAKGIVTSFWQVDHAATRDLMSGFYQNLKTGKPKNIALRDAKLTFLEQHAGEQQHPFFWGGLVGVGDMRPVEVR